MQFRKWVQTFIALTLATLLFGCTSNKETKENYNIQNKEISYINQTQNLYENGLIYSEYVNNSERVGFLEYTTMSGVALCNMPNCQHKDASCIAVRCVEANTGSIHFVYQDKLYWFESDYEIVENEDGTSSQPNITSTLYCSALDTGEVEIVATINGVFADGTEAICIGDTLYMMTSYCMHQMENGTWMMNIGSQEQYLYAFYLDRGEAENLGYINDSPFANNNCIETGNSYGTNYTQVSLDGLFDGKIYMSYRYVENQEDLIHALEAEEESEEDISDASWWQYEVKTYDLETGAIETSTMENSVLITEDYYVFTNENGGYTAIDIEGNSISLQNCPYAYINEYFWLSDGTAYSSADCTTCTLNEKYTDCSAIVLDYVDGQYIIEYYDESGTLCFDKVSEFELIQAAE